MKKLSIIAVTLVVAGTMSSWAQEKDTFLVGPIPVTMTGKLSSSVKANTGSVNAESINGSNVEFAIVQLLDTGVSTNTVYVIGNGLSTVTTNQSPHTNTVFTGTVIWDGDDAVVTKSSKNSQTVLVGMQQVQRVIGVDTDVVVSNATSSIGANVITNSVLLVTVSESQSVKSGVTNNTGSAKFTGIWNETDGTAVAGSITAVKVK
jgi:hypothetical protein